jgi:hypothetical protein
LEISDGMGRSALFIACESTRTDLVKVLLSMGADRFIKDGSGQTTASVVVDACNALQAQATDPKSRAALHQRCLDIIRLLFESPGALSSSSSSTERVSSFFLSSLAPSGDPLLIAAARAGIDVVVAYLLDIDQSCVRFKGRGGDTVFDVYLSCKSSTGLDLLLQRGLVSAMEYASAPRRNSGFDPAHTLKPFWHARR